MANDITYLKVTQLASSNSASTVGAIFPDSQYLDIYGTDSGQVTELSDSNEKIPTSKMVKQELDKELNKKVDKIGNSIITASTSDTPIFLKSTNNLSSWVGFQDSNGTELGYLGVSSNHQPYFYHSQSNPSTQRLAYANDIPTLPAGSATIASINSSNIITLKAGITQTNGAISNSTGSDITLAKVAKTGSYSDLTGSPSITGSATIASVSNNIVTLRAGVTQTNGAISNSSGSNITLAKVAATGSYSDLTGSPSNVVNSIGSVSGAITISNNFQMSGQQLQVKSLPCYITTSGTSGASSNKNIIVLTESQASGITYNSDYIYFITEN